jgi:phospholipase C
MSRAIARRMKQRVQYVVSSFGALGLSIALHGGCGGSAEQAARSADAGGGGAAGEGGADQESLAIEKIKHVIVVMQENRSFDHYFGTFPGAEGIPMDTSGTPTVCNPDPKAGTCVKPFHLTADKNIGGPHSSGAFATCYDGGKLDGFITNAEGAKSGCADPNNPACANGTTVDVMGYHTEAEIPNYWAYARAFVLQDHLFQTNASWSFPMHLFMVSGWSALCQTKGDPSSCATDIDNPGIGGQAAGPGNDYPWTDVTYLLHKHGISWKYYLGEGDDPHCGGDPTECQPMNIQATVPSIWNVLPEFDTVKADGETGNVVPVDQLYQDAKAGQLPAVAWVAPAGVVSEHPANLVSDGEKYVTALINTIMQSPEWSSTAIFVSWDDWGGFYDHVAPPKIDAGGYGLRVPGLVISPYAKKGFVDKQVVSHDQYLKFIEDVFLDGDRIDPRTDGRSDSRPDVREAAPALGTLLNDFDFTQSPRAPMVLPIQ